MSKLISGKEALISWFDGEEVEIRHKSTGWYVFNDHNFGINVFKSSDHEFRIKPRTITINGIGVPAPIKGRPVDGEIYFILSGTNTGYTSSAYTVPSLEGQYIDLYGYWENEEEIKQVVAALHQVFKGEQA